MCFVDVGANWGYFTLLATSLVGPTGRILSLEPDPRLFSILQENIMRSGLDHVTLLQVAAAHESGTLPLVGYIEDGGNFGLTRIAVTSDEPARVFQVKSDSLDNILEQQVLLSVDLMKMDIEGAEALAIRGLEKSLANWKIKRLLLELHPIQLAEHGSNVSAITETLQSSGYKAWTIDHSPIATRQAAYKKEINVNALLRRFDSSGQYDAWPHQLWIAPGVE